ncbi:MAG: outer membrane beta-barrel protein [Deltaproteobacteria bacterium]|nr:outer membrane beta-barrel protein [Deltaproteobacteria bacterium]
MNSSTRLFRALVTCAGLASLTSVAIADGDDAPARNGATFGVGVGGGHIVCTTKDGDDCDGDGANPAGGLDLRAGAMLSPRVALGAEVWGMTHRDDRLKVSQGIIAGVVRGWVADRLWLQGGAGVARTTAEYDLGGLGTFTSKSDWVPAIVLGVGLELVSAPKFALDLELKGGTGLYDHEINVQNISLGVGVSFY